MKAMEEIEKDPQAEPENDNIDKIRDILFGVQVREFETSFSKLEEKFNKEIEYLRNETRSRLDKLEQMITKESNSFTDKMLEEQHLRSDAVEKLSEAVKSVSREFESKISDFRDRTEKKDLELETQVLDQSKTLSDAIQAKRDELFSALEHEAKKLRDDKASRSDLAELFTELATRLNGNFKLPDSDYEMDSQDPPQ